MEDTKNNPEERNPQVIERIRIIEEFIQNHVKEALAKKTAFEIAFLSRGLPKLGEKITEALKVSIRHH
jgi:Trp operon repressor